MGSQSVSPRPDYSICVYISVAHVQREKSQAIRIVQLHNTGKGGRVEDTELGVCEGA